LILLAGAGAALQFAVSPPEDPRWDAHNDFDNSARTGLRLDSGKARRTADGLSSAFLAGNAVLLMGDWVLQRHRYSVMESFRRDATWALSNIVVARGFKLAAARERPFVRGCEAGVVTLGCDYSSDRNASFFSTHTSLSSTIAGLLCARRLHRPDREAGDLWLCGGASSLALATGLMRISADKHYATDVLAGWASGFVFGYALPTRFHYGKRPGQNQGPGPPLHFVTPLVGFDFWGLRYDVSF
jgi:membrane-associated phospholipid phosphatase